MAAWDFLFQKEGPGWSFCVELAPQQRHLLVNNTSYVVTKTPPPPKDSWLRARLYFGIKNVNFFSKHHRELNSPLSISKVTAGEG